MIELKRAGVVFLLVLAILLAAMPSRYPAQEMPATKARPSFSEPSLSADGSEIVFVSGGDIWTVPANGGDARLLVSHPADESRPLLSPDGRRLAFVSTRTGSGDIYVLTLATGELRRLTYDDAPERLDAWSRDGKWIYLSGSSRDISGMNDILRVSPDGGTPLAVTADRYVSEFFAAPSPDGATLAFSARGIAAGQWWRRGHSHIDESEIWLRREGEPARYERLAGRGAKHLWPMWAPDGRTLYYVSDQGGTENIWVHPLAGKGRALTRFTNGRALWPGISGDGRAIVFERDFGIWKVDTGSAQAAEVRIALRGGPAATPVEHLRASSDISGLALSPDGKKIAFIVRGEIFAASAKDGGDAIRVTNTAAAESRIDWASDSRRIAYLSDRDGTEDLFLYDFGTNAETRLTDGEVRHGAPVFSPDGKSVAFDRGGEELVVLDLEKKEPRVVTKAKLHRLPAVPDRALVWSPDGRWLAFVALSTRSFLNVYVSPAAGGGARPVSFLPNGFGGSLNWTPDGEALLFATAQRTEDTQLARVDLTPRTPRFREDQFRDLFRTPEQPAPPPAAQGPAAEQRPAVREGAAAKKQPPKPVEIVFEGIRRRASFLPIGLDLGWPRVSPDGKSVAFVADAAGQQNIYVYGLDELARERPVAKQITSTPGFKSGLHFSPDGKELYYLDQGRIFSATIENRQTKPVAVTAEMDIDFHAEKREMFQQAWTAMRDGFFDAGMNDVNWNGVRERFAPYIEGAQTREQVRRLLSLMIGELNASHLGVNLPGGSSPGTGRLGLRFDRAEYERDGRLRVTEVVPLSPAALKGEVRPGDYLLAVDGARIGPGTNLDQLLEYKVNKRVVLDVSAKADGSEKREVIVRPVNLATEKGLAYRAWVENNRAYVEKASGGRLGYVHMPDMGSDSLTQLYLDLDVDNVSRDGVVVDVRNNNGGFVNVYAIDVLARRHYLNMTFRGRPTAPARSVLGQRSLELPTILLTNQHSLSDAEDFTEGYRSLKLGKVVGEPTAGWIIYTSAVRLIDGSFLRMPFIRITTADGQAMEMNPRPVDVPVERPVGESLVGKDSQLDTAVKELLRDLDGRPRRPPAASAR